MKSNKKSHHIYVLRRVNHTTKGTINVIIFSLPCLRTYTILLSLDTNDKIINDVEIQTFGQELTKSKSDGGCGIMVRRHDLTCVLCGYQLHLPV